MLPVVRGDDETRKQILLYSLVLFGTTLLLVPGRVDGPDLPGHRGRCSAGCSSTGRSAVAPPERRRRWALFKFSIVYLAALFGAVALDALL